MFQSANRDRLLSTVILNVLLAIFIIAVPTIILLGIIGGRMVTFDSGAVIVDVSLGIILVFSSLAAIIVPFVYRIFHSFALELTDLIRTGECYGGNLFGEIMDWSIGATVL